MTLATVSAKPSPLTLPARPYPGLRPFEADEWMIFFGRENMIDDIIERLASQRLVFIHGASGCGKSSLVRAGVLPKLERQHLSHGVSWATCTMRPSNGPLWNLATEFARLEGRANDNERIDEITRICNRRDATFASVAGEIEGLAGKRLCILVDQFEELFRFEREVSREEAELFIDLVVGAIEPGGELLGPPAPRPTVSEHDVDIRVVITMRSEFLADCARFDGLAEAINRTQYLVPRMSREGLLRAIRRPAQIYGGDVTLDLAERLIAEVRGREDELPLIQHGLMLLWEEETTRAQGKNKLDAAVLETRGSLADLLSWHADMVMDNVVKDDLQKRAIEYLFRALIEQTAQRRAVRRPQSFRELVAVSNVGPQELKAIIDAFRADGVSFLMPPASIEIGDETIIDISHEALIRCWKKIAAPAEGWLKRETDAGIAWSLLALEAGDFEDAKNRRWYFTNIWLSHVLDLLYVWQRPRLPERSRWLQSMPKWRQWSTRYGGDPEFVEKLLKVSTRATRTIDRIRIAWLFIAGFATVILIVNIIGLQTTIIITGIIFAILAFLAGGVLYLLIRYGGH